MTNEENSDGIYWESPEGHLVYVGGWYNRVQVEGSWSLAGESLGVDLTKCDNGAYLE